MAIISKNALNVMHIAGKDADLPGMDTVHVRKDGTVIGSARNAVILVSPVRKSIKRNIPIDETELTEDITVPKDGINQMNKFISKDSQFGGLLEYLDIEKSTPVRVRFKALNTKGEEVRMSGGLYRRKYIDYQAVLDRTLNSRVKKRVIVNRARLKLLLEAMEKVCPDTSAESPVYLEFTEQDELVLRSLNRKTGQRALAVMFNYLYKERDWLDENRWEEELRGGDEDE